LALDLHTDHFTLCKTWWCEGIPSINVLLAEGEEEEEKETREGLMLKAPDDQQIGKGIAVFRASDSWRHFFSGNAEPVDGVSSKNFCI